LPLLAQEGQLSEHATRGYVVRAFTAAAIVDAIDVRVLEGCSPASPSAVRQVAAARLRACLEDGDALFGKRRVVEATGAGREMNERFHGLMPGRLAVDRRRGAERNSRVPFAGSQALARQTISSRCTTCCSTHCQHHGIVDALEHGQARAPSADAQHATAVMKDQPGPRARQSLGAARAGAVPVIPSHPWSPGHENLEQLLRANGGGQPLRNSPSGPNPYPVVPPEYTNWRDEQNAWQHAAILFNQSYHMSDLYVSGPDACKLLEKLAVNSFKGFEVNKAKRVRAGELGRTRHRRRDPLLPGQEPFSTWSAARRC
jgi:DNA-binding GntR family transcriptional regulator